MKTTLPKILLLACLLFTGVNRTSYAWSRPLKPFPRSTGDSIFIFKQSLSKSQKILLYPDAGQKVVFFSVKGEEGRAYQLFIFDLEGRLVKQTEIRNKQTTVIKQIEKGIYLFDVFSNDMKIGNGQMTVR
jgi:hypothetical protein